MYLFVLLPAALSIFPNLADVWVNSEVPGDNCCKGFCSSDRNTDCLATAVYASSSFARAAEMIKLCKQDRMPTEKGIYSGFCEPWEVSVLLPWEHGCYMVPDVVNFLSPALAKSLWTGASEHLGFFNPSVVCLVSKSRCYSATWFKKRKDHWRRNCRRECCLGLGSCIFPVLGLLTYWWAVLMSWGGNCPFGTPDS